MIVGLTGGIGSGKTTVSDLFKQLGITIVDADVISRKITAIGGCALKQIEQVFGAAALTEDGAMDRNYMRKLIFDHPEAKKKLEEILHPLIQEECLRELERSCSKYSIISVPLLVESKFWLSKIDRLLVIDVPEDVQIERVMKRSGLTESEVKKIISKQAPRVARLNVADDVIENTAPLPLLEDAVRKLHIIYLGNS